MMGMKSIAVHKRRRYPVALISMLLVIVVLGLLFISRDGVYIITDEAELLLYGRTGATVKTIQAALRLHRPVHIVSMPFSSDRKLLSEFLVRNTSSRGIFVIPSRFQVHGEIFAQQHPDSSVVFWGSGATPFQKSSINYAADLQRAAEIAGPLAVQSGISPALVFPENMDTEMLANLTQAFEEGLVKQGFYNGTVVLTSKNDVLPPVSSMVLFPTTILLPDSSMPVILFSEVRNAFLPDTVIAVFDDSLWPHIADLVSSLKKNEKREYYSELRNPKELFRLRNRF